MSRVENAVAACQRHLDQVAKLHEMILADETLLDGDKAERQSFLRLSRKCVAGAKKEHARMETELERVKALPLREFE